MWCARCYKAPETLSFYHHKAQNEINLVWNKKGDELRFQIGIDGAFLVVPFQCDYCWFEVIKKRSAMSASFADTRLLGYIRRANLDIIWSRAPGTIASVKNGVVQLIKLWHDLGVPVNLPRIGPFSCEDDMGFQVALAQLKYSQRSGTTSQSHLQYDTIRKLRTSFAHVYEVSHAITGTPYSVLKNLKGDNFLLSGCPTDTRLYQMFSRGMLLRMGKQTQSNWGLDFQVLLIILDNLNAELNSNQTTTERKRQVILLGAFFVIGFVCALRGNEIFLVEAEGLCQMISRGRTEEKESFKHVVIPLLGRFKNEDGERWHVMISVDVTSSGIRVREWIERLVVLLNAENSEVGPAFRNKDGSMLDYYWVNSQFISQVDNVQMTHPHLIDPSVDVSEHFSIYRSLRRGSTARASDMKVDSSTIDLHNRWRTSELLGGRRSTKSMRDYYSDLRLTLNTRLSYTRAL